MMRYDWPVCVGQDLAKGQFTKPAYFLAGGSRSTGTNPTQALEEHVNSNVKYII